MKHVHELNDKRARSVCLYFMRIQLEAIEETHAAMERHVRLL
jgi:hypothetical protein